MKTAGSYFRPMMLGKSQLKKAGGGRPRELLLLNSNTFSNEILRRIPLCLVSLLMYLRKLLQLRASLPHLIPEGAGLQPPVWLPPARPL